MTENVPFPEIGGLTVEGADSEELETLFRKTFPDAVLSVKPVEGGAEILLAIPEDKRLLKKMIIFLEGVANKNVPVTNYWIIKVGGANYTEVKRRLEDLKGVRVDDIGSSVQVLVPKSVKGMYDEVMNRLLSLASDNPSISEISRTDPSDP